MKQLLITTCQQKGSIAGVAPYRVVAQYILPSQLDLDLIEVDGVRFELVKPSTSPQPFSEPVILTGRSFLNFEVPLQAWDVQRNRYYAVLVEDGKVIKEATIC